MGDAQRLAVALYVWMSAGHATNATSVSERNDPSNTTYINVATTAASLTGCNRLQKAHLEA